MTEKETRSGQANDLRRRAEEIAREKAARMPENLEALAPEEVRQLLHELRVYQIELDMQNEELRRAEEALQQARDELGQRAARRTEELRRANEELRRTNIIGRRQADAALKEAAEKYRSLAASVDSMYLVDRDCTYLFMNEGHRMRFGLSLEEIIGRRYDEFHSEESTRVFAEKVREVIETGKAVHQERWSERDGRCFLRTFTSVIKRSLAGETSEVVVVSKDITERKRAEKEVIETLQQLRDTKDMLIQFEKHAAIGRLAAGVAHEILNPASIISSRLQFLGEENLSEQARENLRVCREQI
jgi:PAS domain S-box-containing protein